MTKQCFCLRNILKYKMSIILVLLTTLRVTYRPFRPNHPRPTQYLPVLPHSPHCVSSVMIPYPKAVYDLGVLIWFGRGAQRFEIFNCETVFVCWVTENDDINYWSGRCGVLLRRVAHRVDTRGLWNTQQRMGIRVGKH